MTSTPEPPVMFRAARPDTGRDPQFTGPHVLLADVSELQPEIADAAYLAWSRAIVIRCAYGDAHDDKAWYGGQRREFLHQGGARFIGIYAYLVAGQDGGAQADAFHRIVGAIRPGEVFIADFEEGQRSMLTAWYNRMLALYGHGIRPYLWTYSGLFFGEQQGVLPVEWLAAYQDSEPLAPHRLWQFTSSFAVPGVGTADCSVFHGTISELAALTYRAPAPAPADWTYGPPRDLRAEPGHESVRLEWKPPAGAPVLPAEYRVYIYKGTVCDETTLVPSYPRTVKGCPWQGGSLERGREYTAHVTAGTGTRVKAGVYASVTFDTA